MAQATGTYYIHVMGFGVKYDLVVTKNSDFDTGPNQGAHPGAAPGQEDRSPGL